MDVLPQDEAFSESLSGPRIELPCLDCETLAEARHAVKRKQKGRRALTSRMDATVSVEARRGHNYGRMRYARSILLGWQLRLGCRYGVMRRVALGD
jgi:hypothetical protein